MAIYIRTLTVIYDNDIKNGEVPLFRGAVLNSIGESVDLLYHNHTGENTFRYSYPLIQYKRLHGKAAVVCVDNGVDVIGQFLTCMPEELKIGTRVIKPKVEHVIPSRNLVQIWDSVFRYRISRWIPLNGENYQKYKETEGMAERLVLLEGILKGNLLSFLKGLDIYMEKELTVKITSMDEPYLISNKGVKLMAFNACFVTNLSMPDNIGIGKNASIGYGVIHQNRKNNENQQITINGKD